MRLGLALVVAFTVLTPTQERERLLNPADPAFSQPAPARALVRLDTTAGEVVIEVIREWAPRGADRFVNLARHGYYDNSPVFRIRPGTWAQFGIATDPQVAQAWRGRVFPDDPFQQTNARGTVAFAFAAVAGRIFGEPRRPGPITPIPLPQETRSS